MPELDQKATAVFAGKVVRKDLVRKVKVGANVDDQGKVGLYRLEVGTSPGTGKLKSAGGVESTMKESINRAFAYLNGQKVAMGVAHQVDMVDFHVEAIDLLNNHVPCEAGIALVVAVYSAVKKHSVLPSCRASWCSVTSASKATSSPSDRWPNLYRSAWTTAHGER